MKKYIIALLSSIITGLINASITLVLCCGVYLLTANFMTEKQAIAAAGVTIVLLTAINSVLICHVYERSFKKEKSKEQTKD